MARPGFDLSLYLVTDTALCGGFGVPATVRAAVRAGVTVVQLRDHDATDTELVTLGRRVKNALAGTGIPLLVDDRVHLVDEIGAQGAHVGQGDLPAEEARRILGPDALLGLSVQTVAHVEAARALAPGTVDYLGVGPVWAQTTKADAAAPCGVHGLRDIALASQWPCVAIGGIDASRADLVREAGASGMAVVSAICGQLDVGAATARLLDAWRQPAAAVPAPDVPAPGVPAPAIRQTTVA